MTATGNPVPKAGTYYNGADIDYGPSDLSLPHVFVAHGIVQLPWGFEFSGILRIQSGFAYSRGTENNLPDVDGDGKYNGLDIAYVRNSYRAPKFVNTDIRLGKTFNLREKFKVSAYFEMFNLFNNANPVAVGLLPLTPEQVQAGQVQFGDVAQRLPEC